MQRVAMASGPIQCSHAGCARLNVQGAPASCTLYGGSHLDQRLHWNRAQSRPGLTSPGKPSALEHGDQSSASGRTPNFCLFRKCQAESKDEAIQDLL